MLCRSSGETLAGHQESALFVFFALPCDLHILMKATCPTCTAVAMVCTHAHAGAYKNIKLGECWGGAVYRILKALLSNGFKLLLAVRETADLANRLIHNTTYIPYTYCLYRFDSLIFSPVHNTLIHAHTPTKLGRKLGRKIGTGSFGHEQIKIYTDQKLSC